MDYQSFIEQYSTAAIDEAKVAKVEEIYGVELPEEVKHYVSACGGKPVTVVDGENDLFEAFSIGTILDAESPMVTDCVKKNMIALAFCYEGDFLVYMFDDDTWDMYNPGKDEFYYESNSLEDFINNVYFSENEDDEDEEDEDEEPLAKLDELLKGTNVRRMDIFEAAEAGLPEAQFQLGQRYLEGNGVEQSDEKAFEWFLKAAEQNNGNAQFHLGRLYFLGNGVAQDTEEGIKWFKKAADNNTGAAEYFLGMFTEDGEGGFEANEEEAFKLYERAAKHGDGDGVFNLGRCYENGIGVARDLIKAAENYAEAKKMGHDDADDALRDLKETAKDLQKELEERISTDEEISVVDFLELINVCRYNEVDFLWCPSDIKVLHGNELLRMADADSFKEVKKIDKEELNSKFKEELSDKEMEKYNFYRLMGTLPTTFAFKK